jgi:hypothetical protein
MEASFDITAKFDMQELRNAIDQVKREILNRYDFKGVMTEIELTDDKINLHSVSEAKINAIVDVILQKVINRGLSIKILDRTKKSEPAGGDTYRLEIPLRQSLEQEQCKLLSKLIRDEFPKSKSSIQGDAVRVVSKSRDELQEIIAFLRKKEDLDMALTFENYR